MTSPEATHHGEHVVDADAPVIVDVWSRTEPKYRQRAFLFLLLTWALFAGLGCFAFWLRSGVEFAPLMHNYSAEWWQSFNPVAEHQVSLSELLLYPIHLEQVPMQIVVVGLLLSSLASVPILVAILYRFPASLLFVAVVMFLAILPWLGLCGMLGALIASWRKITFRYASAMLGLLPMVVYFIVVSQQESGRVMSPTTPAEQVMLYYPWLIALLGSAVMMALVLIIARVVNYRPGAIAPVLAVMFVIPWVLFETKVGRDELYYRLLENAYGPNSDYFVGGGVDAAIDEVTEKELARDPDPERDPAAVRENTKLAMSQHLEPDFDSGVLAQRRYAVVGACEAFCSSFSYSRYVPNALYIEGMAQDMRIDIDRFMNEERIEFYHDFPSHVSFGTWARVLGNFPHSPVADVAALQTAKLFVRDSRVDDALDVLQRFENGASSAGDNRTGERATGLFGVLEKKPAEATLKLPVRATRSEGRQLRLLLLNNRDAVFGDKPLVALFMLDPQSAFYTRNLEETRAAFPGCKLEDNLLLAEALTIEDRDARTARLRDLLAGDALDDAKPAAIYELGVLLQQAYRADEARAMYDEVAAQYPGTPWADDAKHAIERLDQITQAAQ